MNDEWESSKKSSLFQKVDHLGLFKRFCSH
jgi:hypothetical protein